MRRTEVYQVRLDIQEKKQAFAVFKQLGISPAQAIRLFFRQVVVTRSIPFSIENSPAPLSTKTASAIPPRSTSPLDSQSTMPSSAASRLQAPPLFNQSPILNQSPVLNPSPVAKLALPDLPPENNPVAAHLPIPPDGLSDEDIFQQLDELLKR